MENFTGLKMSTKILKGLKTAILFYRD